MQVYVLGSNFMSRPLVVEVVIADRDCCGVKLGDLSILRDGESYDFIPIHKYSFICKIPSPRRLKEMENGLCELRKLKKKK